MMKDRKDFKVLYMASVFILGVLLSVIPNSISTASRVTPVQVQYKGVIYTYRELNEYKDSVEIIGVTVPEGTDLLKIPKVLNDKKVISINFGRFDSEVLPDQRTAKVGIKKLVLSRNIRPLERTETTNGVIKALTILGFDQLESIEVQQGNKFIKAKDNILYDSSMKTLLCYPPNRKAEEYQMPSSIIWSESIRNNYLKKIRFSNNKNYKEASANFCSNLISIQFPDNIKRIEGFNSCDKLVSIQWSKKTEMIDGFQYCRSIKKIQLPPKVKEIKGDAFRYCTGLKEVKLPAGLRKIHGDAFGGCINLKKISPLPGSLAFIGRGAFAKAPGMKGIKKESYLMSTKNSKITGKDNLADIYRYVAVAVVTNGSKKEFYESLRVNRLSPTKKKMVLGKGKMRGINIVPGITDIEANRFKKGWKLKTDILKFTSSNPRVAKVSQKGKVTGIRKGRAEITVQMRTMDVKCKIEVKVTQ